MGLHWVESAKTTLGKRWLRLAVVLLLAAPVSTARAADVATGFMLDDSGLPLAGSPLQLYDRDYVLLNEGVTGSNGGYCVGDEEIRKRGKYYVCVQVRAGRSACSDGQPNTVAGAMVGKNGSPIRHAEVMVRTTGGMVIAVGRTDDDGLYCITDEEITPGTLYSACVIPASIGSVAGGINGTMYGAENHPLSLASITVRDRQGEAVAVGRTAYDGSYCVTDDEITPQVQHKVCVSMVAQAATCTGGVPTAVSGAFTEVDGHPIRDVAVRVEDADGMIVATGATNENGSYCIVDEHIEAGTLYDVCIGLVPHCACCCNCCCGPLFIAPTAAGWAALGTAAAVGTGIGVVLTGGGKRRSHPRGECMYKAPLKKACHSPFDKLRVSGKPCPAFSFPLLLSPSKHEHAVSQRADKGLLMTEGRSVGSAVRWQVLGIALGLLVWGCGATRAATPLVGSLPDRSADAANQEKLRALFEARQGQERGGEYVLAAGDVVSVTIYDFRPQGADFQSDVRVDDRGYVSLPMIEPVHAAGRNLAELRRGLADALRRADVMKNPLLRVFLKDYQGQEVVILGAVVQPGLYHLSRGQQALVDVLSMAGGLSARAGNYLYLRPAVRGANSDEADTLLGEVALQNVSATEAAENVAAGVVVISIQGAGTAAKSSVMRMPVRGGDLIIVPESGQAFIEGEVAKSGIYPLSHGMTLTQLIATAGGLRFPSNRGRVTVVREGGSSEGSQWEVDLRKIEDQEQPDIVLEPNDRVIVPSRLGRKVVYSVYQAVATIVRISVGGSIPIF